MPEQPRGGKAGQKMGEIAPVFHKRLQDLREQAQRTHNALQGKAQRKWQVPADYTGSLLNIGSLHMPSFDRTAINDSYEAITKDPSKPGTTGDVIGTKLQLDYVAAEERAFRARHTSFCRTMCLGHARRYGQGHGAIWYGKSGVEGLAANFIAAGGVSPSGG